MREAMALHFLRPLHPERLLFAAESGLQVLCLFVVLSCLVVCLFLLCFVRVRARMCVCEQTWLAMLMGDKFAA